MKIIFILFFLNSFLHASNVSDEATWYQMQAKKLGWYSNLKRGSEILQQIASLSAESLGKVDIAEYRGEKVAFVGGVAPPGSSNDLVTEHGFYLRVLNRAGKDLRPQSAVWWDVMICGKILQVFPRNKIIVIEVNEQDWRVTQTG